MNKIASFKDLFRLAPKELQNILWLQWKAPQNPKHHPEGNTLKHISVVVNRAIKNHPNDIDMILAAFFHDLGKYYTLDYKNGQPTAYGHEKKSVEFVDQFSEWIKSMGGDAEKIKFVVANHMKVKNDVWNQMKQSKKDKLINDPNFQSVQNFSNIDKGGLDEVLKNIIKEEISILKGGKSTGMTVKDIADKHNVTVDQIEKQLKKGIKVELEHTKIKEVAHKIAMDHLVELPDYYDRLEKMEKS